MEPSYWKKIIEELKTSYKKFERVYIDEIEEEDYKDPLTSIIFDFFKISFTVMLMILTFLLS